MKIRADRERDKELAECKKKKYHTDWNVYTDRWMYVDGLARFSAPHSLQ